MKQRNAVAITLGAALLSSTFIAHAGNNPFAARELASGYSLAAAEKTREGSCGEGKCGAEMRDKAAGKTGEGKCGADKAGKEGQCGASKASKEGSCGEAGKARHEGKCGSEKTE